MKDRTSITQNINFSVNRMSDIEKLKLVIDYFNIFFTDEMIKHPIKHPIIECTGNLIHGMTKYVL